MTFPAQGCTPPLGDLDTRSTPPGHSVRSSSYKWKQGDHQVKQNDYQIKSTT